MVEKLTEAMISVEGEGLRDKTFVVLEEIKSGNWGIGGHVLHTDDVKAIRIRHR